MERSFKEPDHLKMHRLLNNKKTKMTNKMKNRRNEYIDYKEKASQALKWRG